MEKARPKEGQGKSHLAVIVMGSPADKEYADKIGKTLAEFGVGFEMRIGSAHKSALHVLDIIKDYDQREETDIVYVAVAGRSNALGPFIDANTSNLVISAPPYSEKYSGADIFSSLRLPSGLGNVVATEAELAAIAVAKVLALNNPKIAERLLQHRREMAEGIVEKDKGLLGEQRGSSS